jgi:hypothetical protein
MFEVAEIRIIKIAFQKGKVKNGVVCPPWSFPRPAGSYRQYTFLTRSQLGTGVAFL